MYQIKLKLILYEKGITIRQLAEMVGICQAAMYRKVHGDVEFTYTEVYSICQLLGICEPFDMFIPSSHCESRSSLWTGGERH
ncbi:MAG: helix-turn-helix transcriptional regulator [Clostridiales bacterium]|nr:helix-turn-helix transcriptional regulator [Clostridiales bacterium]